MHKPPLYIIKIGGHVLDDVPTLQSFLNMLQKFQHPYILVHGGGKKATALSRQLGIETQLHEGRRITDDATRDVVVMVYAGLINKQLVAQLQSRNINAIGLSGADANLLPARKREHTDIDFGWVGDVYGSNINTNLLQQLINQRLVPVVAPITHNNKGELLNTNADAIASHLAIAMSPSFTVSLVYCFEKNGVLANADNNTSVVQLLNQQQFNLLKTNGCIHSGMIPKLTQAFDALQQGVSDIYITHALHLLHLNTPDYEGTRLA